jgi:hypothetical protein
MRKNHIHSSGNSKRAIAHKYAYKSGIDQTVAEQIKSTPYVLKYETENIFKLRATWH